MVLHNLLDAQSDTERDKLNQLTHFFSCPSIKILITSYIVTHTHILDSLFFVLFILKLYIYVI